MGRTYLKQLKNRYKAEEMDVLFGKVPACKHEDLRLVLRNYVRCQAKQHMSVT